MASAKTRRIALWTLSLAMAAMFLMSGSGKLANAPTPEGDWDAQFVAWGFPAWARIVVGAAEVAAAIVLLAPRVRFYGAAALVGIMLGAVGTHLANEEWLGAPIPLALAVIAGVVAWMTRPAWVQHRLGRRVDVSA